MLLLKLLSTTDLITSIIILAVKNRFYKTSVCCFPCVQHSTDSICSCSIYLKEPVHAERRFTDLLYSGRTFHHWFGSVILKLGWITFEFRARSSYFNKSRIIVVYRFGSPPAECPLTNLALKVDFRAVCQVSSWAEAKPQHICLKTIPAPELL